MPSIKFTTSILAAVFLATSALAAPAGTAPAPEATAPYANTDPNKVLWTETQGMYPQPVRGNLGAPMLGPQNVVIDLQNADLLAPPSTDAGTV